MSTNQSFVNDLVEMAKAFEALPRVQQELADTRGQLSSAQDTIAQRETSILSHKQQIEALQAQLRKVEAERDDAMSAFLEADDRVSAFKRLVAGFSTDAQALVKADEPKQEVTTQAPQTEPQPQPEPTVTGIAGNVDSQTAPVGQSEEGKQPDAGGQEASPTTVHSEPVASQDTAASTEGQSAPVPSSDATPSRAPASEEASASPTASSSADAGSPTSDEPSYANEPPRYTSEWYDWANRMDSHYGPGMWPDREAAQ